MPKTLLVMLEEDVLKTLNFAAIAKALGPEEAEVQIRDLVEKGLVFPMDDLEPISDCIIQLTSAFAEI